jgi:ribonuclease E
LRDLAGLIVIDFIDMDEKRNNRTVERRLKDALKNDRARIQVGRISHFGLLEMSRQRIRTSVLESSTEKCPHCGGTGHMRSVSSVALQLLRSLEETILKGATHNLIVRTRPEIALYVLNHKRAHLRSLEERFHITITVNSDPQIGGQIAFAIDRGEQAMTIEQAKALLAQAEAAAPPVLEEEEDLAIVEEEEELEASGGHEDHAEAQPQTPEALQPRQYDGEREGGDGPRRRRRRRRGRGGQGREHVQFTHETVPEHVVTHEEDFEDVGGVAPAPSGFAPQPPQPPQQHPGEERGDGERRPRRRGRRGGRRNRRDRENFGDSGGEQFRGPPAEVTEPPYAQPFETAAPESPPAAPRPTPIAAAPVTPPPVSQPEPESPRRRSTVREPAPIFGGHAAETPPPVFTPAPSTQTAASSSSESEGTSKPRRTGWWAKRLLGDKG